MLPNTYIPINPIPNTDLKDIVDSDEPTSASIDFISNEFDRFWRNYPYKKSKVTASKAFAKLVKGKKQGQVKFWVDMILNYHHGCIERQDIGADKLHAATLLNQKRWDDDPEFVSEFKKEWLNEHGKS